MINSPLEFHEGAAIPPKKLFGSEGLCIITSVDPLLSQSSWNALQSNLNISNYQWFNYKVSIIIKKQKELIYFILWMKFY